MTRTLFNISDDLLELGAILAQAGGEITDDEAGKALEAFFEQLGAERDRKIDNYCALIREMEARAEAREVEAKRLMALAATDYNEAERFTKRLKLFMEIQKLKRIDTARFRISIVGNGGKAPLIVPDEWEKNPAAAPEQFHRRKIELDKDAIRKAIDEFTMAIASVVAGIEDAAAREAEVDAWMQTGAGRRLKEQIEGCAIGPRGTRLQIK